MELRNRIQWSLDDGTGVLRVRVTPSRVRIDGSRVRADAAVAPEDGKANKQVIKLWAKELGLPQSALAIIRGHTSRDKT